MGYSDQFFGAIGVDSGRGGNLAVFAKHSGVTAARLKYYNDNNVFPSGNDLPKILKASGVSQLALMLKMGHLNTEIIELIQNNAEAIESVLPSLDHTRDCPQSSYKLELQTKLGKLYRGDCIEVLRDTDNDTVDLVFADPPFNLNKLYPSNIDDSIKTEKYLRWCEDWISECIRVLKPGGALFLWNLPKWNAILTKFLESRLTFKHWIGVDIKYGLPISGRLYPSHYSLLYYVNGEKPNTFHPDRLPMQTCPHCYKEIKDYGGYKNKMNPSGISLTDIWTDIPPVRHSKYKKRDGANELSLKLLDRIIEIASNEGDLILDPFGGSGTTYMTAELKNRRWIGCEIGPVKDIKSRFDDIGLERQILNDYRHKINALFPVDVNQKRIDLGLWTCESVRETKSPKSNSSTTRRKIRAG